MMKVVKGLFIKPRWIELILEGKKTWEMRSMGTSHRGWFGLVGSGTGKVWGIANLIAVGRRQSFSEMLATVDKHQIPEALIRSGEVNKWTSPWILGDVRRLPRPVPTRAKGQIWVNLEPEMSEAIAKQVANGNEVHETRPTGLPACETPSRAPIELGASAFSTADIQTARTIGETEVTSGNIKNSHFYLRSFAALFPPSLIGGRNSSPPQLAKVSSDGMFATTTDICPRHLIFRDRSWTRAFLVNSDAVPGDVVRVVELHPFHYQIDLVKGT